MKDVTENIENVTYKRSIVVVVVVCVLWACRNFDGTGYLNEWLPLFLLYITFQVESVSFVVDNKDDGDGGKGKEQTVVRKPMLFGIFMCAAVNSFGKGQQSGKNITYVCTRPRNG